MANIDRAFVGIGLLWLVLGMFLGLHMGATADNTYLQVHTVMLLGGFVVLTFYGAIYRLWPAMKDGALAKAQFWSAALASFTMVVGTIPPVMQRGVAVVAGGSVLAIAGAMLMLWIFWARSGDARSR